MLSYLWLVLALPFAGFVVLAIGGARLSKSLVACIGVGTIGASAILSILIGASFLIAPPVHHAYTQTLWTWMHVGDFTQQISIYLDALSLIMMLVVTFVSFWIHLYSAEFMDRDEGYSRYFAYMNLFVGSMLTLVLADNLLLLYLGWEGVGLCSYLLIGFWYTDPVNGIAACKAFIVTRIGDTAMLIGLFLLFFNLHTLQIQDLMRRAVEQWPIGSGLATAAAALLLGGAVGKSAQLPLQTWLPDAMAGPAPVSSLIHAATMVTAGVYLIARTNALFALAPVVQTIVAIIGAVTLVGAGFSALTQWDIKRVLAYSTISQIGYMFLALGVGAWSAAIFHFMTHAFFKSLLFLGAGVVIQAQHHEHNMFKMGGLRKQLPVTFWTFLIGSCSLAALPLVTAGFYSKDLILWDAWNSQQGSPWLWVAGMVGAFVTSLYTFRMVFLTFFGEQRKPVEHKPRPRVTVALVVLAAFALCSGFLELPRTLGDVPLFTRFLHHALPDVIARPFHTGLQLLFQIVTGIVVLAGIYLSYLLFLRDPGFVQRATATEVGTALHRFWFSGWRFDRLYDRLLVQPFIWFARIDKGDVTDLIYSELAAVTRMLHGWISETQTGRLRWYAMGIAFGAVIILAIVRIV
jgi:NADH-quinone oxidoreductase subunit L